MPGEFALVSSYPNPFNASTIIEFSLPEETKVSVEVSNLTGQLVETLVDRYLQAGEHDVTWDASVYSSGIYFYKLSTSNKTFSKFGRSKSLWF
ncbi:MAG: T9SS type A sorting domain-containing protein [candidate division Zixibacteria bacterium]|nr:T9SS type A sorting domain-containing protein [candidate division Zixibacteria bacterium]